MENLKIELNFCCIQLNSSFTSQINRETWSFWHQDLVAHQIWMKITLWISQNGIVSRMGCIYHERVKSRIHSCDNHLDIHRKRDKNWKWLVKYVYRLFFFDIFVCACVCVCPYENCEHWIDQPKYHPQQDISCESDVLCVFITFDSHWSQLKYAV